MLTVNMAVFGCGELCSIILALHCFIFYIQYPRYKNEQRYLQTETDFISPDGEWSVFILLKDSSLGQLLHLFLITISFRQTADCFQLNFSYFQFNLKCLFSITFSTCKKTIAFNSSTTSSPCANKKKN